MTVRLSELAQQAIDPARKAVWNASKRRLEVSGINSALISGRETALLHRHATSLIEPSSTVQFPLGETGQKPTGWSHERWKQLGAQAVHSLPPGRQLGPRSQGVINLIELLTSDNRLSKNKRYQLAAELLIITEMAWHEAAHVLMALQLGHSARVIWNGPSEALRSSHAEVRYDANPLHLAAIGMAPLGVEIGSGSSRRTQPSAEDAELINEALSKLSEPAHRQQTEHLWKLAAIRCSTTWASASQPVIDEIATSLLARMDSVAELHPERCPPRWLNSSPLAHWHASEHSWEQASINACQQ